jgi:hypothetical protein
VKYKKSVWGLGEDEPHYSTAVEDHNYGVIYFALDNLCPPAISEALRVISCLLGLGQKYESLFIRPKK